MNKLVTIIKQTYKEQNKVQQKAQSSASDNKPEQPSSTNPVKHNGEI